MIHEVSRILRYRYYYDTVQVGVKVCDTGRILACDALIHEVVRYRYRYYYGNFARFAILVQVGFSHVVWIVEGVLQMQRLPSVHVEISISC